MTLRYTLLSDGTSDRALLPIIDWSVGLEGHVSSLQSQWADLSHLRLRPRSLSDKIRVSLDLYPCDLLFVHRDAEKDLITSREQEVSEALSKLAPLAPNFSWVPVVPVRMTEAWLLISENALRGASGNPSGSFPLTFPKLSTLESQADPKELLLSLLKDASGLSGRRLARLDVYACRLRLAELITDFSPLLELKSFQKFRTHLKSALSQLTEPVA